MWGSAAVPNIMQNTMPMKLRRAVFCAASSAPGKACECGSACCRPVGEDLAHLLLFRVGGDFLLHFTKLLQRITIGELRNRYARMFHAQPYDGSQIGNNEDDVLGHLGPGHRPHA